MAGSRVSFAHWLAVGVSVVVALSTGCRTYVYQGRPHYYYQDEAGRIFVRRPIIEVHGTVDIVR